MTKPACLASIIPGTGTVLYGRGQLGSIRLKSSRLPAFSFLAVLILCWPVLQIQTFFEHPDPGLKNVGIHIKMSRILVTFKEY